jgi:2-keto-4-pentenoate hydratase/2-oxohepta-3-ene-1,7-dioic acid hydratase in catechol pathway
MTLTVVTSGCNVVQVRLVTYENGAGPSRVGMLLGDGVHDAGFDGTMIDLIEAWDAEADRVARHAESAPLVEGARLLAPLHPRSLRDFLAFEGHLKDVMRSLGRPVASEWYTTPAYYKGLPDTVIGTDVEIPWPSYAEKLDYELELACVIGRRGRNIRPEDALEHVFGWTIWNDVSARDVQTRELPIGMGPAKAKDWDGSNVLGPCLVTADVVDVEDLEMQVSVNGEVWGRDNAGNMFHKFGDLIAYAAQDQTLHPGDVIGSGTAQGGSAVELGRTVSPGDEVRMRIAGIGELVNTVGAPRSVPA